MRYSIASVLALTAVAIAAPKPDPQVVPDPVKEYKTFEADDPNPHQVYLYKQVTGNHNCGDSSEGSTECSVGEEQSESYGISFGADISGAGWVSAGFSVSKEVSSGTTTECTNKRQDNKGEDGKLAKTVCMWKRIPHTEYTVQDWMRTRGPNGSQDWVEDSDEYQMWSPNDADMYETVCAWEDECEAAGNEWWGPSRKAGGPTEYPFPDERWQ